MSDSDAESECICAICCNDLDLTDQSIQYCGCGFQPCLWCYHHILEEANKESLPARCPNCRAEYDQNKITMQHVDAEQLEIEKRKLREKDRPKAAGSAAARSLRANLTNVRVVQPNLVYCVGLPMEICYEEVLKDTEFFGQFGKTVKISTNRSNQYASAVAKHGPTGSAYVTYRRAEDALRCIKTLDGSLWRGKPVKACFGTTKYCNAFLKGLSCNNPDCLYLHDLADDADCLTKEEVAAGLLPARFLAMGASNTFKPRLTINLIPNAATAAAQVAAAAAAAAGQSSAAITAAAAAAGGVHRHLSGAAQPPPHAMAPAAPRVITIPAGGARSGSQGSLSHHEGGGGTGSGPGSLRSYGASPATGGGPVAAVMPPAAVPAAPKGLWASAAAGVAVAVAPLAPMLGSSGMGMGMAASSSVSAAAPPPPPPTDKQEWPTLASAPAAASTLPSAAAAGREGEGSSGATIARQPSMAEQLARAHSNAADAKIKPKKLLPLPSPAKLKTIGKTPQRSCSPALADAAAMAALRAAEGAAAESAAAAAAAAAGYGGEAAAMPPLPPGVTASFGVLSLGGSSGLDPQAALGMRRPPPGFGSAAGAAQGVEPESSFPQPLSQTQQQRPRAVGPPPGFAGAAGSSFSSAHSSVDSGAQLAGGAGGGGASNGGGLSSSGSLGFGSSSLFDTQQQPGASRPPVVAAIQPSRRQKSRFAFAHSEEEEHAAAALGGTASSSSGAGGGGGGGYGGLGQPSHQQQQQHQDASSFFKTLFPGANVSVASAPPPHYHHQQQQQQQQQQQKMAAPPGFNLGPPPAPSGAAGAPQASYNPLVAAGIFQASPVSGQHAVPLPSPSGLAPGLALLRQLQQGGDAAGQQRPAPPPGYGGAPPGFGNAHVGA